MWVLMPQSPPLLGSPFHLPVDRVFIKDETMLASSEPRACFRSPLPGRMDPFADTLQRLREAFSSGRTRPVEFRATQLKGLGRFLQENKQLLQEALAQDLHKVGE